MPSASLRLTMTPPSGEAIFGRLLRLLEQPFAGQVGTDAIGELHRSVAQEFTQGGWSAPEGGVRPWPQVREFGTRPAPSIALGGPQGSLAQAWATGAVEHRGDRVSISSDHPAGYFHRGGEDASIDRFEYDITAKAAGYIRHTFGVGVEPGQTFVLPARPHATTNPNLEQALAERLSRAISEAL